ncbi:hypothetical protein FNH22_16900 [Fulvivirga sp. M361]|uniref:hypothetical protein n=1 Tax=Fulvivirga sp. M361 TaxID=2594266 RepID=UPI00117B3AFC|nr:hypothetical protein [Fulvivirga sp. M361]TRX56056.1 hypothetical protein FNH22_16900 [Fulvivirga sp. M361]
MKDFSKMDKAWFRPFGLLCLALVLNACNKCDECTGKFDLRLQFSDLNNTPVLTQVDSLLVTDLSGVPFMAESVLSIEDTIFQVSLNYEDPLLEPPDSILIIYNNALIDTAATEFGFTSDSDCCDNVFTIDDVRFFNRKVNRLVRPRGTVFRVIIE